MKMAAPTKNLFESMTRRRVSCPQVTQQLWDAIKSIRNTRQVPTSERIQKIMQKEFGINEEEVTRQLNHCVRDGLIEVTKRTVSKGNNAGSEQEWYKLPILKLKTDEYDWYCFDCHRAGDVICCSKSSCQRVYHLACISSSELPQESFICHVCRICQPSPSKFQLKRSKLNRLLGHPLAKLKSKYPLTLKDQRLPPPNKNILVSDRVAQALTPPAMPPPDESESWRTYLLIAREMNLTIVEEKIDRHRYRLLEEFHADCLNILHNMVIYNGVDSAVADIARQMLRDCVEDLQEIRQCVDCYKMSHGQKKQWFAKPCRKPHELVYAKQSGLPYWPAKVMKIENDQYDVRLFGAQHPRVLVPKSLIRPISVNIHTLQVKRSSAWNRACEELKKHQELLEKARVETRNFTVFIESSSSEESESVDSETERKMERELRNSKVKVFIEKQTAAELKQKQKLKRRRSSSTVPPPEKKRGRPKAVDNTQAINKGPTPKPAASRPGRKRKETYDSSDSLDSFNVSMENAPKKNTDEIFDELLKSAPSATASVHDDKAKKISEPSRRAPRKPASKTKPLEKRGELSEESKTKSDTLDSSTMSSFDTDITSGRRKPLSFGSKKYSSTDDSDSEDSDLGSSSSARRKPPSRQRPLRPKKPESRPTNDKSADLSDDDTTTTETDSDGTKKTTDKAKPNGKIDDSSSISSDTDDDSIVKPITRKTPPTKKPGRPPSARGKAPPKRKRSDSSDSASLSSVKATTRSKAKDTSESTDVDTPLPKKPQSKPAAKKVTPTVLSKAKPKVSDRTPQRASQRNLNKSSEKKDEGKVVNNGSEKVLDDNDDSTDSETPLSAKTSRKPNQDEEIRNILDKYTNHVTEEDSRPNESSDSDTKSNKQDSDSETEDDASEKKVEKAKLEVVEDKVQKGNKAKAATEEKKGRGKKSDVKEELKEKEETIVSSSSQEPVTRSVAVQTDSYQRVASLPPDLIHRADRISELEKELQIQAQTNRLLEMEFDKTKVLIERMRSDHDDELAEVNARHVVQISEIKKKQWCYNCETEAIYHCCWNTAYCSVECQQAHWQSEHKRVCRRKR